MFTGIVEEVGFVTDVVDGVDGKSIRISAEVTRDGASPGDSIAVSGTCLTITDLDRDWFTFGVAPETLRRTNLSRLRPGDAVNLERSLTPTSRIGGHFVQGHIDGTGIVASVTPDGESRRLRVKAPSELMRWVVTKGYVALDGISLTIVEVLDDAFTVMLVPYTMEHVMPQICHVGHVTNIEVDILGKYVSKSLAWHSASKTDYGVEI